METGLLSNVFRQPAGIPGRLTGYLQSLKGKDRSAWTISQLNIQSYQHILEIGFGPGNTLDEVARKLKVGFLAGIDPSVTMYQQAYRRNRRHIQQQLMQLHLGDLCELPYPPNYFHTIYGSNVHFFWKDPLGELIRLTSLLRPGGRLVQVFQPRWARKATDIREIAERTRQDYINAGLCNVQVEYRDMYPVTCISLIGFRP
jgi:trans-aconitate methyltransferase